MNPTHDPDLAISAWVADGPTELDDSVRRMVIADTFRTPQRPRRGDLFGITWHIAVAAAAAAIVVLVGVGWLLGMGPLSRVGGPDASITPHSTPRPGSTPGSVTDFVRPFAFVLPPETSLEVTTHGTRWVAFTAGSDVESGRDQQPGSWGVIVADVTGAKTEEGLGRADVLLGYPGFFEDLEGNASVDVVAQTAIELDARPAIQGDLEASGGSAYPHIHLEWGAEDSVELPFIDLPYPTRLIVSDVGGRIVLIQVWARSPADYRAWLPIAMELVDSITFPGYP
jgi:hypothetical protein